MNTEPRDSAVERAADVLTEGRYIEIGGSYMRADRPKALHAAQALANAGLLTAGCGCPCHYTCSAGGAMNTEPRELECPDCGRVDCACDHDRFMFQEAEEDERRERPICDIDGCGYYAATHIGLSALCAKHALALIGRSEVSDFAPGVSDEQ
jgi:hypothetical protein